MIKEVEAIGKDITEAKENARIALGADELADVKYEILHAGSKGLLGFFTKPARVKASMEIPDATPRRAAPQQSGSQKSERPAERRQGGESRRPKRESKPQREPAAKPQSAPKKRSEVIPESQIKLTPVEKQPGEDRALDFVNQLIANLGIEATAALYSSEDGNRRIVITGEGASILIGHHGDTLDSLQYLANLACTQPNASGERDHSRVTIDIEGYRAKREEALRALARRMAEKSLRTKRNVTLEPMNPYDRRIIHDEVSGIEGVTTSSIGSDSSRRVVIFFEKNGEKKVQKPAEPEIEIEVTVEDAPAVEAAPAVETEPVEEIALAVEETPAAEETAADDAIESKDEDDSSI